MAAEVRRVLMTADTVGGVWTYALDLCRGLADQGVEVLLATMGAPLSRSQWSQAQALGNVRIAESRYKLEWMEDPWRDVQHAGTWLLQLERAFRPHLVHLNGYAHAVLPFQAPVLVAAHSCVLSWWRAVRGTPVPDSWSEYRRAVSAGLRAAHGVVAPSSFMAREVQTLYGLPRPVLVVPNGRRGGLFQPGVKENVIFAAGRFWDEAKNLAVLDAAAAQLPWPVRLAGDTTHPEGGTAAVRQVQPLGRLTECGVADELARAAIYASPARYEPFGLSVLEAALAGCALVLADIPSLRELWGGAASFVPAHDVPAWTDRLQSLCGQPGLVESYAVAARLRARQYSLTAMTERYCQLYARLATAARPAAAPAEIVSAAV